MSRPPSSGIIGEHNRIDVLKQGNPRLLLLLVQRTDCSHDLQNRVSQFIERLFWNAPTPMTGCYGFPDLLQIAHHVVRVECIDRCLEDGNYAESVTAESFGALKVKFNFN